MKGEKKEVATAIKLEDGTIEENSDEIKEIFRDLYDKLLKDRKPEDEEERLVQVLKEHCMTILEKAAKRKK